LRGTARPHSPPGERELRVGLCLDSFERNEQAAVRALEAVVAGSRSREQLLAELLFAMRAGHLVDRRLGAIVGHASTVAEPRAVDSAEVLTRLGLYKRFGENPEQTWPFARRVSTPIINLLSPSWGYGHELMPADGGAVVAVNHFSAVDPAVVGLHSRRTLYYMAKIELLRVPIAGELLRWTGAFAVRRGEGDRDSIRVARWAVREGHVVGVFAEGTRQHLGHPGPMHPGAAMLAIQEGVPVVPGAVDSFGWSFRNRRTCCMVWGEPLRLDLPRTGKGYKEGTAILEELVLGLWRLAAQATADRWPPLLANGLERRPPIPFRDGIIHPDLPGWPEEDWAAGPLGPVYRGMRITAT
jgi:1-acyl-sn-glycerol-3-phosphate acyltransferase